MTLPPLLLRGDVVEQLKRIPSESIDAIVCDPPYGIGFMGKKWDGPAGMLGQLATGERRSEGGGLMLGGTHSRGLIDNDSRAFQAWCEAWARECHRILKPGGHLVAFGATRTAHRLAAGIEDAGFEIRDTLAWMYGQGMPKAKGILKPAFEPIVLARKPFKGTLRANIARYGVGGLFIDAVRLLGAKPATTRGASSKATSMSGTLGAQGRIEDDGAGRWPTNVTLDEAAAAALDAQAGRRGAAAPASGPTGSGRSTSASRGAFSGTDAPAPFHDDSGGPSRFMYVAKAPKSERPVVDGVAHPTVKPLALMRWLIRLVVPEGGVLVDPFAGSGTTLEAAYLEQRESIGIELTPDYWPLIEARIARAIGT